MNCINRLLDLAEVAAGLIAIEQVPPARLHHGEGTVTSHHSFLRRPRPSHTEKGHSAMNSFRLLALSAMLLIGIPVSGHAKTVFPPFGGQGNTETPAICGQGQYVVGFEGRVGSWIDQLKPICATVLAGGKRGNNNYDRDALGGNGGSPSEVNCPDQGFVHQIHVGVTKNGQIGRLVFNCTGIHEGQIFGGTGYSVSGNPDRDYQSQACPSGEIATGVNVRWGKHVNAVGLICDTLVVPAASQPAPEINRSANPTDFQGTWNTTVRQSQFKLVLRVSGMSVTGEYTNPDHPDWSGTITGQLKKYDDNSDGFVRLNYTWDSSQLGQSGEGSWDVTNDGKLIGGFTVKEPGKKGKYYRWAGTRVSREAPAGTLTGGGTTTGGGETATMVNATTVYNQPGGNDVCYTQPGDTGKVLQKQDGEPRWVLLSGITGDCGGKNGWVWRGDENEDVTLN